MKRFSMLCVATLTSVAALSCVSPVAWASANETPTSDARSEVATSQLGNEGDYLASVTYHVGSGISLGAPTAADKERVRTLTEFPNVGDKSGGFAIAIPPWVGRDDKSSAKVSWPILRQDGSRTGYDVIARIGFMNGARASGTCQISGPLGPDHGRFDCSMNQRLWDWDWDLYLTDSTVHRLSEASGSIKTDGSVTLKDGKFSTSSAVRLDGADEVPAGSSTQFDAVLSRNEKTSEPGVARMKFTYGIYLPDQPGYVKSGGRLYVRGDIHTYPGGISGINLLGSSSCDIVDSEDRVVENTGYSCTVKDARSDGNDHYIADFTVSKKK